MKGRLPKVHLLILLLLLSPVAYFYARHTPIGSIGSPNPASIRSAAFHDADAGQSTDTLLDRAISMLEGHHSIAADVRYQADLFGKQLAGKGDYREERSGPVPKIRLELEMPLGDKLGAVVEVCDGHYVWTYLRLFEEEELSRIDLERVARETTHPGDAVSAGPLGGTLGMGGLAGLLRALKRNYRFEVVGQSQFLGEPTWQLQGQWLPDRLAAAAPQQKDAILRGEPPDNASLPAHLPSHVVLTLGRDNLLPYRVEYRRPAATEKSRRGRAPLSGQGGVTMEWFNFRSNAPMKPSDFEYRPGDINVSDITEQLIQKRG